MYVTYNENHDNFPLLGIKDLIFDRKEPLSYTVDTFGV
jgi:hypothetical protein